MHLTFLVAGSAPEPYRVEFLKEGDRLTALCTCQAGQKRQACKHRLSLMAGYATGLDGENTNDVSALTDLLAGTQLHAAYQRVAEAEAASAAADKALPAAKRELSRVMHG